jgi:multimeric flavodoxin WrbA
MKYLVGNEKVFYDFIESIDKEDKVAKRELENIVESQIRLLNHYITDSIYTGSKEVKWFFKGDEKKPDLMYELDIYDKLQSCDAFIIVSPIHWYSLTSQVKTFFDRLVCVNQTLAVDDAKKLMGPDNIKDSKVTGKLSKSGKYENMLRNHLEGKVAAFYVHGDDGAKDYTKNPLPESYDVMIDPFSIDPKSAVLPYIMQMKYSGVFVPDELVQAFHINKGVDYYTSNVTFDKQKEFKERADELLENLLTYLEDKKL